MALPASEIQNRKADIIRLIKEIKELTGAYGVFGLDDEKRDIELQIPLEKIIELNSPITMWDFDPDKVSIRYQIETTIEGVKYFKLMSLDEIKGQDILKPIWEDYCSINDLCPYCGTENEETDAGKHCPRHCWGECK